MSTVKLSDVKYGIPGRRSPAAGPSRTPAILISGPDVENTANKVGVAFQSKSSRLEGRGSYLIANVELAHLTWKNSPSMPTTEFGRKKKKKSSTQRAAFNLQLPRPEDDPQVGESKERNVGRIWGWNRMILILFLTRCMIFPSLFPPGVYLPISAMGARGVKTRGFPFSQDTGVRPPPRLTGSATRSIGRTSRDSRSQLVTPAPPQRDRAQQSRSA